MKTTSKMVLSFVVALMMFSTQALNIQATTNQQPSDENNVASQDSQQHATYEGKVEAVDALIANIGTVTLQSKDAIQEARAAYDALTDSERALSLNGYLLFEAERVYESLVHVPSKNMGKLEQLDYRMGNIEDFTIENWQEINNVNNLYQALSAEEKAQLQNGATFLQKYQEYLLRYEQKDGLETANFDASNVEAFIAMIESAENKELYISQARNAYDALSDEQKQLVSNYQVLLDAEAGQQEDYKEDAEAKEEVKPLEKENVETGSLAALPWMIGLGASAFGIVGLKRKKDH